MDFALILVLLTATAGVVWLLDVALLRRDRIATVASGEPVQEPIVVEYAKSFFPILLLVLLILLHRGRGGGLSTLFGGGVQSSLSGSSVVEKNLDRMTLFVAAIWIIAIIGTGLLVKAGV